MKDMKKVLIEMLYDEELKEHLGFPKSLFLGILKVEKKWTTKVQNWGIIYSHLTILFADRLPNCGSIL